MEAIGELTKAYDEPYIYLSGHDADHHGDHLPKAFLTSPTAHLVPRGSVLNGPDQLPVSF